MKRFSIIFFICVFVTTYYSCKKDLINSATSQLDSEYICVKLNLSGEILLQNEELGARDMLMDTTMYGVSVIDENGKDFAQGLFTSPDSISIYLVKEKRYTFKVAVIKKGSGSGLYSDNRGGFPFIYPPIQKQLNNKFYLASVWLSGYVTSGYLDTFEFLYSSDGSKYSIPEVDTYFGITDFIPTDTNNTFTVTLKRLSFGVQFNIINYTGGILYPSYNNVMAASEINSAGLQPVKIYTTDYFRNEDSLSAESIPLSLSWYKNDGTIHVITDRTYLHPKRNQIMLINVTLPLSTSKPNIAITETEWVGENQVDL